MGALYYSDVATLFLRGRLAIVCGLVTIRACLRLPQISRSASAPVGCRWHWQTGHPCQDKTNCFHRGNTFHRFPRAVRGCEDSR